MDTDDEGCTYEAILLLSVFILMPNRQKDVMTILRNNSDDLIDFITNFVQPNKEQDKDFDKLKLALKNKLQQIKR